MKIGVAILAGGQAQRLCGIAKGNIKIGQKQTIINRMLNQIREAGLTDVIISANNSQPYLQYQIPIIADEIKQQGPLAGIISALNYFSNKNYAKVIFIPSDLPNITLHELRALKDEDFAYAKTKQQIHPLCATVPINKLASVAKIFANGERKILKVWETIEGKALEFEDENKFININSEAEFKKYSRALIWIISGAGRGVGKTNLANNLSSVLPDSIYAKYGHGKFKPHKQPNFFHNLEDIISFVDKYFTQKQHIILEVNTLMLTEIGDIKIFIDAVANTRLRKDAKELKSAANIIISEQCEQIMWPRILNNYALSASEINGVVAKFKNVSLS